jgi:mannosyl-oligosaccharide alpha-1,3-glucosidase
MAIGVDYTFVDSFNVYGLAEHSDGLELKETRGANKKFEDPYRLYNLDVFEYVLDVNTALYGSGISLFVVYVLSAVCFIS